MPKWLVVIVGLVATAACIPEVRNRVINSLKMHPALVGPALTLLAIAAVLYLFIDPITVLFIAAIALVAGLAALLDPKTYSRKPPA
jgi:energy-converting hydrogenase Eha subunit E